jgi:3-oxoacyl-[acyl-carrier protein] reductase
MKLSLQEKTAVVCGSTQGIGRATAQELAALGASVVLVGRDAEKLSAVFSQLDTTQGQKHQSLVADFSSAAKVQRAIEGFVSAGGRAEILINNTGGPTPGPAHQADTSAFLAAFEQHLICGQLLVQALLPGMKEARYGRIINVISTSVKQPIPGLGVSNTIRGAVASWSKTLATELGPFGITVNNVLPGPTETQRLAQIFDNKAQKSGRPRADIVAEELAQVPARRFAAPEELAYAIAFLASPSAGFINGINLPVDGGRTQSL